MNWDYNIQCGLTDPQFYSLTHLLTDSLAHLLTDSLTHLLTDPLSHPLIYLFSYSLTAQGYFNIDDLNPDCLAVTLPEGGTSGTTKEYINNSKLKHGFQFNGILPMSATQDEVFKKVGQAAVNNVLGTEIALT